MKVCWQGPCPRVGLRLAEAGRDIEHVACGEVAVGEESGVTRIEKKSVLENAS